MFGNVYGGKTVLVTGGTGFCGSWLATWLQHLGARVVVLGLAPLPDVHNAHLAMDLNRQVTSLRGSVLDEGRVRDVFACHRPEIVFHLAAQALTGLAIGDPVGTLQTNAIGTARVLDNALHCPDTRAVVCVTSDKCYLNREWPWGYREGDALGGHEPYGVSKALAEQVISLYRDRAFCAATAPDAGPMPIGAGRAGNVIGGGDWSPGRIIPDVVRAMRAETPIVLRDPKATRPWQHVLDALSGYLRLGQRMVETGLFSESFNFGPSGPSATVEQVVQSFLAASEAKTPILAVPERRGVESKLLRLDCALAETELGWTPVLSLRESIEATAEWYRQYYADYASMRRTAIEQIDIYAALAKDRGHAWA